MRPRERWEIGEHGHTLARILPAIEQLIGNTIDRLPAPVHFVAAANVVFAAKPATGVNPLE